MARRRSRSRSVRRPKGRYRFTAARRRALKKAQLASARARKNRRTKKIKKYGKSRKSANAYQKTQRIKRVGRRIQYANAALVVGAASSELRKINRDIAYTGMHRNYKGQLFNQQGGPRVLRVRPTAKGRLRYNRAQFRKRHGRDALRNLKRQHKAQQRRVRYASRGPTTMSWGVRTNPQRALPVGRGRGSYTGRRVRGY